MSSILRRIFKGKRADNYEISIIGLDNAGKTTIVNRLLRSEFVPTTRTLGVNYRIVKYRNIEFNLVDLGGQEIYRNLLWHDSLQTASAIVFVLDSADIRITEASTAFWDSIQLNEKAPVLFIANKIDLPGARSFDNIVKDLDLTRATRTTGRPVGLFRISAKTGENFYDAIDWLADILTGTESTFKCKVRVVIMIDLESHKIWTTKFTNIEGKILEELNAGISETMAQLSKNSAGMEILTASDLQLAVIKNHPLVVGLIIGYSDSTVRAKLIAERLMKTASSSIEIGQFDSRIMTNLLEKQWPLDIYKPKQNQ
ncbi:MAG: ADP-ribosylation factor family protein [Candidatus Hodarchaeales archaeon]